MTVSRKAQICQFTEICKKQMVLVCQILLEWCTGQIFSKFIFIKKQILIEWWQCYLRELNRYCSWTGICEKQMVPFLIEWWQCLNLTALDRYCPWTGFGWNFLCWSYLAFYTVLNFSPIQQKINIDSVRPHSSVFSGKPSSTNSWKLSLVLSCFLSCLQFQSNSTKDKYLFWWVLDRTRQSLYQICSPGKAGLACGQRQHKQKTQFNKIHKIQCAHYRLQSRKKI